MNNVSRTAICRGAIFHSRLFETTQIGHGKFFVVIGEDDNHIVGYFFFNTDISNSVRAKSKLFELQFFAKKENYSFLNYSSYIGCHNLMRISKWDLSKSIDQGQTVCRGVMTCEDMDLILEVVRGSDVFSEVEKQTFFK